MAYIGSVTVSISQQAVRPREPAPPPPKAVVASPLMASRQARPRSSTAPSSAKVAASFVAQIAQYKGQQKRLEQVLHLIGVELKKCKNIVNNVSLAKTQPAVVADAKACVLALEKAAIQCINAIKACAGKANQAADAAIATGASLTQVRQAQIVTPGKTLEVETRTPKVVPGGTVVPGPDARVVDVPTVLETVDPGTPPGVEVVPGEASEEVAAAEAAAGIPGWVKIGAAVGVGFLVLRMIRK